MWVLPTSLQYVLHTLSLLSILSRFHIKQQQQHFHQIGPHTGGKLWTAETYKDESLLLKGITYANNGPGIIDCHNNWKLFNGCAEHETTPFKGIRISFVAFTSCWYNDLSKEVANELEEMGFTAFGVGAVSSHVARLDRFTCLFLSSHERSNIKN